MFDGQKLLRAADEWFDSATMQKGGEYRQQGRVQILSVKENEEGFWELSARVRGSKPEPYRVEIEIDDVDGDIGFDCYCSCPVFLDCKHGAACLLEVAANPSNWFKSVAGEIPDERGDGNLLLFPWSPEPQGALAGPLTKAAPASLDPELESWLGKLQKAAAAPAGNKAEGAERAARASGQLLYVLRNSGPRVKIELMSSWLTPSGQYSRPTSYAFTNITQRRTFDPFVTPADIKLVRAITQAQEGVYAYEWFLAGEEGAGLLADMLATGRCHWRGASKKLTALALGEPRLGKPGWRMDAKGNQRTCFEVDPPATQILPVLPPWYIDETAGSCGPVEASISPSLVTAWLSAPVVVPDRSSACVTALSAQARGILPPPTPIVVEETNSNPAVYLRLYSAWVQPRYRYGNYGGATKPEEVNFAELVFEYGDTKVPVFSNKSDIETFLDGKFRRIRRAQRFEARVLEILEDEGLYRASQALESHNPGAHGKALAMDEEAGWLPFVNTMLPALRQRGWRVEIEDSFKWRIVEPQEWYSDVSAQDNVNDWFGVELGVLVDGQKINLLPLLLAMGIETFENLGEGELIPVPLPDGRNVMFPAARAKRMMGTILELFNPNALDAKGRMRLPRVRAAELAGEADWRWLGPEELKRLNTKLRDFSGIVPVPAPSELRAELRPYQQEGLNWLQFLREYELAGVLADDMGLGKTVQALAHLLVEKRAGRMDKPSLVVAPTSLMTNWRQEAERFAPALRLLVLHGLDRKQHFERLADYDLVITSYPLLPRDQEILVNQEFHLLILDEAQYIKNPKTQYAQVACALKARHHLCLTGTPMENHLGELWSLFRFLLPGFLGDEVRFNRIFRRPIEKLLDDDRRKLLARRVAPFVLRRKKEQVAKELPPKTEIIQNVELAGAQRDLYESVRLSMHQRVREEVNSKGLSRAHIIILDALLKLRQICCHPQLLSLPSAKKVKESAKLDLLLDLLPEMIEEGRRILLFSQFTSMLAIIEREVEHLKIPYVLLTGDTLDRATPVERFQSGKVPLFLISLKAGGTGLNLTAADTVIHYDPWWNPAVENQATDRAHRIGQDKKVFVYKLMTVGTVEEKISAMQARKRELVEGLLNENRAANLKLTPEDLEVLFAPLASAAEPRAKLVAETRMER